MSDVQRAISAPSLRVVKSNISGMQGKFVSHVYYIYAFGLPESHFDKNRPNLPSKKNFSPFHLHDAFEGAGCTAKPPEACAMVGGISLWRIVSAQIPTMKVSVPDTQ